MVSIHVSQQQRGKALLVDQICEQFEVAIRAGRSPRIEDLISCQEDVDDLGTLVIELILIELEIANATGQQVEQSNYLSRFPDYSEEILKLFGENRPPQNESTEDVLESPAELPGYRFVKELGRGGMGVVWEAVDLHLGRRVAVKQLFPRFHSKRDHMSQFRREASVISRLRHEGIVQVFGIVEHHDQCFLILEYVDGSSLNEFLNGKQHSLTWCIDVILNIARAVDHAHQAGIIHRDLKPGNVLVSAKVDQRLSDILHRDFIEGSSAGESMPCRVIVTDFGLAKQLNSAETISQEGATFGTPSYMSPEQADGRSFEVTPASDVYSLGAVFYEMLTGRPPFRGENHLKTLRLVCEATPVPIRELRPDVPPEIEAICMTCLKKQPQDRYPTMAHLIEDIEALIKKSRRAENPSARSEGVVTEIRARIARRLASIVGR